MPKKFYEIVRWSIICGKREAPALLELIRLGRKGTKILAFFASVHIRQFFDYIDYSQQVSVTTTKLECFPFGKTFG